jgi:hypothetical protein
LQDNAVRNLVLRVQRVGHTPNEVLNFDDDQSAGDAARLRPPLDAGASLRIPINGFLPIVQRELGAVGDGLNVIENALGGIGRAFYQCVREALPRKIMTPTVLFASVFGLTAWLCTSAGTTDATLLNSGVASNPPASI